MKKTLFGFIAALGMLAVTLFTFTPAFAGYNPSGAKADSTVGEFRHASPFSYNYVFDQVSLWIPVTAVHLQVSSSGDITSTVKGVGVGERTISEINSSEITGITLTSDADTVSFIMPIPKDIDLAQPIYIRELWNESSGSATGSMKFTHAYKVITTGTTGLGAAATTTGITNGALVADSATAYAMQWSNWTTIAASTFSGTPGDDFWIIQSIADVTTISDCQLFGWQMKYSRKWLGGDR